MTEVFSKIVSLCLALGCRDIVKQPGCQEFQIDEHWWFALNPHFEPVLCGSGKEVPSGSAYFEFNGWPAGFVGLDGGVIAAGSLANEETLIAALDVAIKKLEVPK